MKFPRARIFFSPILRKHGLVGSLNWNDDTIRTIRIDPTARSIGRVLLHEYIHIEHPDWSEKKVLDEEGRRWGRMSWKDKARLYKRLSRARLEIEEALED